MYIQLKCTIVLGTMWYRDLFTELGTNVFVKFIKM